MFPCQQFRKTHYLFFFFFWKGKHSFCYDTNTRQTQTSSSICSQKPHRHVMIDKLFLSFFFPLLTHYPKRGKKSKAKSQKGTPCILLILSSNVHQTTCYNFLIMQIARNKKSPSLIVQYIII